jgi:hypothetical protein
LECLKGVSLGYGLTRKHYTILESLSQGQTLELIPKIRNLRRKKSNNIGSGPNVIKNVRDKLQCLSLVSISSLVYFM